MANDYTINYDDRRFQEVESDKKTALNELNKTYDSMINQSDKYYQAQIDASKQWADKQTQLQNEQTDFAIEQIEQQKDQAKKDYTKEQSGAYVDWQKQSGEYGANAEAMAAQGMVGTGYSESAQVSMYNTYQNRIATARESYNRAVLNYDNAIKDARLQNNAALAEIAYNALQQQLELSLAGFQYKNQLVLAKSEAKRETDNTYYGRYQDVLSQINTENALAEEVRQYNEKMAEEKRQFDAQMAEEKRQFNIVQAGKNSGGSGGGGSSGGSVKKSSGGSSSGGSVKKSSGTKKVIETDSNTSNAPQIDAQSVLALGYGPISGKKLRELENSGIVESYVSKGKKKYRKTASTNKQFQLYKSLG